MVVVRVLRARAMYRLLVVMVPVSFLTHSRSKVERIPCSILTRFARTMYLLVALLETRAQKR